MSSLEPYSAPRFIYYPVEQDLSCKIALVALKLNISTDFDEISESPNKLFRIKKDRIEDIQAIYIDAIRKVADKVNMICFGELTYPFSDDIKLNKRFRDQLQKLSKSNDLYIIAGSYHDFTAKAGERYNISLIFSPHRSQPFKQCKCKSATQVGEFCDSPIDKGVNVIGTHAGKFSVLICVDVEDRNIWAKIGERNSKSKYRSIHYVLSPSFDSSYKMVNQAEALSKTHKICVAFINACETTAAQQPVFYKNSGERIEPTIIDDLIYIYDLVSDDVRQPIQRIELSPIN